MKVWQVSHIYNPYNMDGCESYGNDLYVNRQAAFAAMKDAIANIKQKYTNGNAAGDYFDEYGKPREDIKEETMTTSDSEFYDCIHCRTGVRLFGFYVRNVEVKE